LCSQKARKDSDNNDARLLRLWDRRIHVLYIHCACASHHEEGETRGRWPSCALVITTTPGPQLVASRRGAQRLSLATKETKISSEPQIQSRQRGSEGATTDMHALVPAAEYACSAYGRRGVQGTGMGSRRSVIDRCRGLAGSISCGSMHGSAVCPPRMGAVAAVRAGSFDSRPQPSAACFSCLSARCHPTASSAAAVHGGHMDAHEHEPRTLACTTVHVLLLLDLLV